MIQRYDLAELLDEELQAEVKEASRHRIGYFHLVQLPEGTEVILQTQSPKISLRR